jgi:flagellar hook-associated protein 1 FlgK
MSLTLALNSAVAGLQVNQASIQVTSNNVANANTPGYTRKVASQEQVRLGGVGAGVKLSNVGRQVDTYLTKELRTALGQLGDLKVQSIYYERLETLFGAPGSNSSLSASLDRFGQAVQAIAAAPEDPTLRSQVVAQGVSLSLQISQAAASVQQLRQQADADISAAIEIVNTELGTIQKLNVEIARMKALDQGTAELEDQRDAALKRLSEQMDVSTFTRESGEMVIMNRAGRVMLDGSAELLSHNAVSNMQADLVYPGGVDGITLNGVDVTAEFRSGRIAGLIEMRDNTLPNLAAETNQLATSLRDAVNRVHNEGSGLPAAGTLTGSRAQTGTAASLTGTVRITLVNADGTQAFTAVVPAPGTLDAAGFAAAINTALAGFGGSSASESGGVVTIDGAGYGVVLSGGTVDPGGGAPATNVSDFLHLNDFFVGDNPTGSDYASVMSVRSDIVANPNLLSRGELRLDALSGNYYLSAGDDAVVQRLAETMTGTVAFPAAGAMAAVTQGFSAYAASILAKTASDQASIDTQLGSKQAVTDELQFRADSASGVNLDEEMANLVTLQNAYAASARLITTVTEMFDMLMSIGR